MSRDIKKLKASLILTLVLSLSLSLYPVPEVNAGEITGVVESPTDLGVVSVGSMVVFGFGAAFSDAVQSMTVL